jgi:hypothetical protein
MSMLCSDTGSQEAIRFEHLDTPTAEQVNTMIGLFKRLFHGNGRITLIVNGGVVSEFETNTKTPNRRRKPA